MVKRVPASVKKALANLAEAVAPTCEAPHFGGICGAPAKFRGLIFKKKLCKFHSIERRGLEDCKPL